MKRRIVAVIEVEDLDGEPPHIVANMVECWSQSILKYGLGGKARVISATESDSDIASHYLRYEYLTGVKSRSDRYDYVGPFDTVEHAQSHQALWGPTCARISKAL